MAMNLISRSQPTAAAFPYGATNDSHHILGNVLGRGSFSLLVLVHSSKIEPMKNRVKFTQDKIASLKALKSPCQMTELMARDPARPRPTQLILVT